MVSVAQWSKAEIVSPQNFSSWAILQIYEADFYADSENDIIFG